MNNRYEEYASLSPKLPFVFHPRLKRTDLIYSTETNWHENLEIQFCDEGSGTVLIDGEHTEFSKGDTVVINSNVIHHTGTQGELTYSCLIIDQKFCQDADIDPSHIRFTPYIKDTRIRDIFSDIEALYNSSDNTRVAKLRAIVLSLLIILRDDYTLEEASDNHMDSSYESIKMAIAFIRSNYNRKFSLDELAKGVYANKYVLSRSFKRLVGRTVTDYTNEYRVKRAFLLISQGSNVGEAAILCGFNNFSFFTKMFKRYYGRLPSEVKCQP